MSNTPQYRRRYWRNMAVIWAKMLLVNVFTPRRIWYRGVFCDLCRDLWRWARATPLEYEHWKVAE
jgi:hypothetical protein